MEGRFLKHMGTTLAVWSVTIVTGSGWYIDIIINYTYLLLLLVIMTFHISTLHVVKYILIFAEFV